MKMSHDGRSLEQDCKECKVQWRCHMMEEVRNKIVKDCKVQWKCHVMEEVRNKIVKCSENVTWWKKLGTRLQKIVKITKCSENVTWWKKLGAGL